MTTLMSIVLVLFLWCVYWKAVSGFSPAPLFALRITRDRGWFRVFGHGFGWKNVQKAPLMFSQRGNVKQFGNWAIWRLK